MRGFAGIVQGEKALAKLSHGRTRTTHDPYGPGSFPKPYLPSERGAWPEALTRHVA